MTALTSRQSVDAFLAQRVLAVAGVSRSRQGFGYAAWRALVGKGYRALPVNRGGGEIDGERCYASLAELPADVGGVLMVTPPAETEKLVRDAADRGIRHVWMQQGAASPAAVEFCNNRGIDAVTGHCILMFVEPGGIHKVHRWIWGVFGKLPR